MGREETARYHQRLAELASGWFRQAGRLDVYLQYEFTGDTAAPGREEVLAALDALVTGAIRASGALEGPDRWLNLTVDRQQRGLSLLCASAGDCAAELAELTALGAVATLHQHSDGYDLTVEWSAAGGGESC